MECNKIRRATTDDADEIAALFVKVTDNMIFLGIRQWNYTYPLAEHVLEDIKLGSAFVYISHGSIAGTVTLDQQHDVQYENIRWKYDSKNVLVIHRLEVHPEFQSLGIGSKLCIFAESYGDTIGMDTIRLDTYSLNSASNHLYRSLGYKQAEGNCYFHNNEIPFFCYEKCIRLPFIHII